MADRIKLTALFIVALVALCTLGLIVYNFVANDWRLDTDPFDLRAVFGDGEEEVQADERFWSGAYHYGDSVRSVRIVSQTLRIEIRRSFSDELDVYLALTGDATDSTRFTTSLHVTAEGVLEINAAPTAAAGNASGVLRVLAPLHFPLSVSSADGNVSLEGCDGLFDVTTTSGAIDAAGLRGTLRCMSTSGPIALDACVADSIVVSTAGAVSLALTDALVRAHGGTLVATEHFGSLDAVVRDDATVDMLSTTSAVRITSREGNVALRVLDGARFTFDASAPEGTIVAHVPLDTASTPPPSHRELRATMNGGGVPAAINAETGSIQILIFRSRD